MLKTMEAAETSRGARQSGGYAVAFFTKLALFVSRARPVRAACSHQRTRKVPVSHWQLTFSCSSYDGTVQLATYKRL